MNLFSTILTYPAPSANYRGESELTRTVIQKITDGGQEYAIISPEAMRNALRELLASKGDGYGLPCNRSRLHDEEQLAVKFESLPNPERYADDFFFGFLVAATGKDRQKMKEKATKEGIPHFAFKRDSVVRMNLAKALEPYRHNAVFTQSPLSAEGSAYQNARTSALLHRETSFTPFQYPLAVNFNDCSAKPEWTRALLRAVGELSSVAGNHARSYYEMAPASIVARLTSQLAAGFDLYGFRIRKTMAEPGTVPQEVQTHTFPEVLGGLLHEPPDFPPNEFFLGGKIVKDMPEDTIAKLRKLGVTLERDPRKLLEHIADRGLGGPGKAAQQ